VGEEIQVGIEQRGSCGKIRHRFHVSQNARIPSGGAYRAALSTKIEEGLGR
jgi:hypothetical protein